MVFLNILFAFLAVGILGGLLGVGLAFASKLLAVKKNEKLERIESVLPGLNCGACGYAGCSAYAEAVYNNEASLTLCAPGGHRTAAALAKEMGQELVEGAEKMVAQVHCRGGKEESTYEFDYKGIEDCTALHLLFGGDKTCKYSCLQLGSCIRVCPVDAISYDDEGKVWVDRDVCISCGKCIEVCPTGVMKFIPYSADYIVACNNTEKGAKVRKYCKVGCIACKLCERKTSMAGYEVTDNLSRIDYSAKGDRSMGAKVCPTKCIIPAVEETVEAKSEIEEENE